jgi:hypothetical protein
MMYIMCYLCLIMLCSNCIYLCMDYKLQSHIIVAYTRHGSYLMVLEENILCGMAKPGWMGTLQLQIFNIGFNIKFQ